MPVAYDQSVDLGFSAKVEGAGDISALADKIDELGKGAGAAQPQFVELSAQLRELGKSDAAINAFREARLESQRLTGGLNEASAAVDRLASELAQAKQQTQAAAVAQSEAASALAQARQRQDDLRVSVMSASNSLAALKDRARESGQYAEIYAGQIAVARARLDELKDAHSLAKAEVNALAVDQRAAAAAVKELSGAEKDLQKDYERSVRWAGDLSGALKSQNTNLDVARESLKALGIDSSKLSETQSRLTADIARTKQAVAELGERFKATASESNTVNAALAKLGIRSAPQIEADILEINQALQKLAIRSNLTAEEFERAATAANGKLAALKAELQGLPVAEAAHGFDLASAALNTLKTAAAGFIGAELGQKFIETNLSADRLQKALQAINGDAQKTASDLVFLKETANRLGINLESSSGGFVKMSAAAKGTRLEGQATRDIFEQMSKGMSQLGLSSAVTERAFLAISQMMSKGTVSAEELKGQLGDALPGVMPIAARAVGLTTVEFEKLLASGSVLAEDFLPRFAAEVAKSFGGADGDVQGLSNSIERFKNMWSELLTAVGQGGGLKIMGVAAAAANAVFVVLASTIGVVINGLVGLAETAGVVVAAFTSKDFSNVKEEVSKIGARMSETNEKLAELSNRSLGLASAMATVAVETNASSAEVKSHAKAWEQTNAAFARGEKELNDIAELTKASTAADRERANVLVRIAELSDDDQAKRLAKIEVTRQEAIISQQTAEVLQSEAGLAQSKLLALQKEVEGEKNLNEQKRKVIEDAEQHAKVKAEQAKGAIAAADAARVAAAAAEVEAAAWYDNSGRVKELKAAYEQAALKVDVLKAAQAAGKDVTSELTAAQTASARAHALLTDALRDQTEKINQNLALKQGQINVEQAGVRLAIEQQRTIMEVARAKGDEYGATQALLEMKKLEIKLAELTAQAKKAEAEAAVLAIKAKREELEATNGLTPAKEAELKAQEASAKVKQVEAQIAGETAGRMRELTELTIANGNATLGAISSHERFADGLRGVGAAAQQSARDVDGYAASLNAAERAERDMVAGRNSPMDTSSILDDPAVRNRKGSIDISTEMFRMGASIEEVKAAQKYYGELYNRNAATMLTGNMGDSASAARLSNYAIKKAIEDSLELARTEISTGKAVDLGTSVSDLMAESLAKKRIGGLFAQETAIKAAGQAALAQPINITIGGKTTKLNMASAGDADALTGILRQLEDDGRRAY